MLIVVSLRLRKKIVRSWQPLQMELWYSNPCLKNELCRIKHSLLQLLLATWIFCLYQFYCNAIFIKSSYKKTNFHRIQKQCHQDNPSFVCLKFYKHNCLKILSDNTCYNKQVKNSIEMAVKDSHSTPSSNTLKRGNYYKLYYHIFLFWFLCIYHHKLVKHII